MDKQWIALAATVALGACAGCSGVRQTDRDYMVHAESIRLFGIALPADDMAMARKIVPEDAATEVVDTGGIWGAFGHVGAADWTSVWGILGQIFSVNWTEISGTKKL